MIGQRIQHLRKKNALSLTELSQRAGVAKSYLSSIERGLQQNPSIQFLEKISEVLGVSVEVLIHDNKTVQAVNTLDREWEQLVREAMASGVSKEQFKQFLESNQWKFNKK